MTLADPNQPADPIEAPEALIRAALARCDRHRVSWSNWIRGGVLVAAAMLLLLATATIYFYNKAPSPFDLRVMGKCSILAVVCWIRGTNRKCTGRFDGSRTRFAIS